MIPKELIVLRVQMKGHSMDGFFYVASADDGEAQTQPEKSLLKAIDAFGAFYKASTGKSLNKLDRLLLYRLRSCTLLEPI